jgi:hypothetical protein
MANWRQIQGRIRRARTSADPVGKLSELYQKTRDAMVAFEVATLEEKAGHAEEAVRWFTTAAERFRRAEWRQKAAEALTRLGAPVPEFSAEAAPRATSEVEPAAETEVSAPSISTAEENPEPAQMPTAPHAAPGGERKRRRGRRGGRRHKRRGAGGAVTAAGAAASASSPSPRHAGAAVPRAAEPFRPESYVPSPSVIEPVSPHAEADPSLSVERVTYIRAGEPALASRFAHLESLLRRLISGALHRVDETEDAPAGPGVFLLSDSDLTTNYYVEACQTLRVGAAQLVRAGRAGRGAREHGNASLRAQMAEHLGISEAKVSDYLKKHCVVRWLQLDVDAPHLAHFAIAVLRPVLNEN